MKQTMFVLSSILFFGGFAFAPTPISVPVPIQMIQLESLDLPSSEVKTKTPDHSEIIFKNLEMAIRSHQATMSSA